MHMTGLLATMHASETSANSGPLNMATLRIVQLLCGDHQGDYGKKRRERERREYEETEKERQE